MSRAIAVPAATRRIDAGQALRQYAALSGRSIVNIVRSPAEFVPSLTFPLLFLAINTAALTDTTRLPGFPGDSFLDFAVVGTILQGVLFAAMTPGAHLARDVENGFFERLLSSPVARTSIIVRRLASAALLGFVAVLWFHVVTLPFGLEVAGGLPAVLAIALVCAVLAAGIGALVVALALRTGSSEAVQGSLPLIFVMLFLSSAFFPVAMMSGWFANVAERNPLTWLIDSVRHLVIFGFDWGEVARATTVAAGFLVVGVAVAGAALRARLRKGD